VIAATTTEVDILNWAIFGKPIIPSEKDINADNEWAVKQKNRIAFAEKFKKAGDEIDSVLSKSNEQLARLRGATDFDVAAEKIKKFMEPFRNPEAIALTNRKLAELKKTFSEITAITKDEAVKKFFEGISQATPREKALSGLREELEKIKTPESELYAILGRSADAFDASGISRALNEAMKSLGKIGAELSPELQILQQFRDILTEKGISGTAAVNAIAQVEAATKLATARREQAEATKKATEEEKKLQDTLRSLTDTPLTKFAELADDLAKGLRKGLITAEQYKDALGGARKSAVSSLMSDLNASKYSAPSAMSYGSRELVNAIADRSGGQNQQIKEAVKRLDNISRSINRIETKMPDLKAG